MTCDRCNTEIRVGDFPFCPHGPTSNVAVIGDDIPGGMVVENGFEAPIRVYSHSEHRRLLAEQGLEIRAKWAGPNDKHLSRWVSVDLDAATALVSRGVEAFEAKRRKFPIEVAPQDRVPVTITKTDAGTFTDVVRVELP